MQVNFKLGYALGGGGARGLSHIGVLKVLEREGLRPHFIAGTSIGALIGALYASGLTADELENLAVSFNSRNLTRFLDISVPIIGLIQGKRVTTLIESLLGRLRFSDLKVPLACVATDINSGQEVVIRRGSVVEAVMASIAIPGIMRPVLVGKKWLVDGGIVNEVPASICRAMGANYVIGVNVVPDPAKVFRKSERRKLQLLRTSGGVSEDACQSKAPRLIDVLIHALLISGYRVAVENLKETDLAILPEVAGIGFWEFYKAPEAIALGEAAAWAALKRAGNSLRRYSRTTAKR